MRNVLFLVVLFFGGCISNKTTLPAHVDNINQPHELSNEQIDLISNSINHFPNQSQFAIAFIQNDEIKFYGLQRQNDTLKNLDNSGSVFEIGSLTKIFTSHLLLNLLNSESIGSLDDPIGPYLDFKINNNPEISFKQLSNHTSGLPSDLNISIFNAKNPYKNYRKDKFVKFLSTKVELVNKPGEKYLYSNLGMGLLGYAIRQIKKEDFETLLQDEICSPAQMENTTTYKEKIKDNLVQGYNWKGKPTKNWDLAELESAGAILSTVEDLSKYAIWNFEALNGDLSLMKEKTISVSETMDVSIGWHIIKNITEQDFLWHNGGTGGYKSSMAISPVSKTSIIILTNVGATNNPQKGLIDKLCFDLMKTLEK